MCVTDTDMRCHTDSRIIHLEMKYSLLIARLKLAFMEKRHSVPDILSLLYAADKDKLTCFYTEPCLRSAKTMYEIFRFFEKESKYFSYTIVERFVTKSGCKKSKELMKNYIQEIENSCIGIPTDKVEYQNFANIFTIICEKDTLLVKELNNIIKTLERDLKLPRASILVMDVIPKYFIICKISLKVKKHVLRHQHELKDLSDLRITSLIIDDVKIYSDDDNKVTKFKQS